MKDKGIHYIIFTEDGIVKKDSPLDFPKTNVKLIIKRRFRKNSSGGSHKYYSNEIFDSNIEISSDKTFDWGYLKCKIIEDERWFPLYDGNTKYAVTLDIEILDSLNRLRTYHFNMESKNVFNEIEDKLNIINNFGSHLGAIEVENQSKYIKTLEKRISELESLVTKINNILF